MGKKVEMKSLDDQAQKCIDPFPVGTCISLSNVYSKEQFRINHKVRLFVCLYSNSVAISWKIESSDLEQFTTPFINHTDQC